jgi:hypothetical protein
MPGGGSVTLDPAATGWSADGAVRLTVPQLTVQFKGSAHSATQGFVVLDGGNGAGCGEKRVDFQRTWLHASRIRGALNGCWAIQQL